MNNLRKTALLTVLTILSTQLYGGTLSYLPMSPKEGTEITIEYTPTTQDKDWTKQAGNFHAVVFAFTFENDVPTAYETGLSKSGDRMTGIFQLPEGTVMVMFKVGDGKRYDTNGDTYWSTVVYGSNGRPLMGAYMKEASTYFGALPPNCKREQDLNESLSMLSKELMAYPSNITARVNQVFISMQLGEIDDQEGTAKLREIVGNNLQASSSLDAIALAQAFEKLEKHEEAVRVMNDAVRRFPNGKAEEQLDIQQLQNVADINTFADRVVLHLKKYPESFAKQNLIDIIVKASTQKGELTALADFLDKCAGIPAMSYYLAVNYLGANDTLRAVAYDYIEKGLVSATDATTKPVYMGISEWKQEQRIATAQLLFVKGALYRVDKQPAKAEKLLVSSIEIAGEDVDKAPYEILATLYMEQGNKVQALEVASSALAVGAASQVVVDMYRSIARENGADSMKVESEIAKLKSKGRSKHLAKLSQEMLNLSLIDGEIKGLDGKPVKLSSFAGSVVVLDYWATWCGPCKMSFPSLQKLYDRYKNNPKVRFAIVNVWEKDADRYKIVKDFLTANPSYKFPMFVDEKDQLVSKYGVTGIPTKFYLGMDGKIQFKEVGLLPDEQFLEEATNRIELLLKQE